MGFLHSNNNVFTPNFQLPMAKNNSPVATNIFKSTLPTNFEYIIIATMQPIPLGTIDSPEVKASEPETVVEQSLLDNSEE